MAQHDYVIDNQTFPQTRADLNALFAAIKSSNSGTSEPTNPTRGQFWYDENVNLLKIYNGTAFVTLPLDGTVDFAALATAIIASQAEAEAGTATDKLMTPQRVSQAIAALAAGGALVHLETVTTTTAVASLTTATSPFANASYDDFFVLFHMRINTATGTNFRSGTQIPNSFSRTTGYNGGSSWVSLNQDSAATSDLIPSNANTYATNNVLRLGGYGFVYNKENLVLDTRYSNATTGNHVIGFLNARYNTSPTNFDIRNQTGTMLADSFISIYGVRKS